MERSFFSFVQFFSIPFALIQKWRYQCALGAMTGFIAGLLLSFLNPVNPFFAHRLDLWILPFVYAFATFGVTVLMTRMVNFFALRILKQDYYTLGQIIWITLLYNLVLIFGGRFLSFFLQDGAYNHERMDYVFWTWHFYVYLISCACYMVLIKYMEFRLASDVESAITLRQEVFQQENTLLEVVPESFVEEVQVEEADTDLLASVTEPVSPRFLPLDAAEIDITSIVFIKSFKKYLDIYYEHEGKIEVHVIRAVLGSIESSLVDYPELMRCHKSYVVNLRRVKRISGNAKGYFLHLENVAEPIPVSRTLNAEIFEKVRAYKSA